MDTGAAQAKVQVVIGTGLALTPFAVDMLKAVSLIGSAIVAVTGAIIGIHGVYKIFRGKRRRRP